MKILLLGADGQLGRRLRTSLGPLGTLIASSRQGNGDDFVCDLRDSHSLVALLDAERPDLIVNAAAYTAVDAAESDVMAARDLNAVVPAILGETLAKWNGAIIHYSTDYVFDGAETTRYTETDPTRPQSVYGQTKLEGELALAKSGVDHLILRTAWVYDQNGKNFLTTMLRLASAGSTIRVIDDQFGTPTSAAFLARSTSVIASSWMRQLADRRARAGIYHLTCRGETSWFGFANAILLEAARAGGIRGTPHAMPIRTADYPTPARRPRYSVLDTSRVQDTFAIAPPHWLNELHDVFRDSTQTAIQHD